MEQLGSINAASQKLTLPPDWEPKLMKLRFQVLKFDEYITSQLVFLQLAGVAVPV